MTLPPEIPQELVDLVLDFVSSRKSRRTTERFSTLAACTLVCRCWTRSSRLHMFYRITLTEANTGRFHALLESPHTTIILSAIREIVFKISRNVDPHLEGVVKALGTLLTGAKRCWIRSDPQWEPIFELLSGLGTSFPSIQHLCMHQFMVEDNFCILPPFISSFNALKSLELALFTVSSNTPDLPSSLPPPEMTSLTITNGKSEMLNWLGGVSPPLLLPTLVLYDTEEEDFLAIAAYLKIAGTAIHSLTLHIRRQFDGGNYDIFDLGLNTGLRYLELVVLVDDAIPALVAILGTVRAEGLEEIKMIIRGRLDDLENCPWDDLDRALESSLLRSVRRFRVRRAKTRDSMPMDCRKTWRMRQIKERLPFSYARGVLA
ncbi:hypothetical protein B0H17DRAFT_1328574 [Mycena rosella]|uniref:F-box domain-containing protein n=1 Tax=Mycena rosella TaxID=1033263 RepID=A0AAD7GPX5_MYCRO|nr:hypothetical protein B0H17DRAFT_1328574 [Mycena rosella]